MEKELLNRILNRVDSQLSSKGSRIFEKNCIPIDINRKNFHKIENSSSGKKMAFIDGGNAEILKAPNFSLQSVRTYCAIYQHNRRISSKKKDFFLLVTAGEACNAELFSAASNTSESFRFNPFDDSLKQGGHQIELKKIAGTIRNMLELRQAIEITKNKDACIIVMDGRLEFDTKQETELLNQLKTVAEQNNTAITALSKTTNLITNEGNSISLVIGGIAPEEEWYYSPLAEKEDTCIGLAKLNKNSEYIFRFDTLKQAGNTNEILDLLKHNSKDPIFPGYPYGLIEADQFARVSNAEKEQLKMQLTVAAGGRWEKISRCIRSADAHNILDNIS